MQIHVNDETGEVAAGSSVADLLESRHGHLPQGIALAVNGEVVPRSRWSAQVLHEGDRVLVLQAVQGG